MAGHRISRTREDQKVLHVDWMHLIWQHFALQKMHNLFLDAAKSCFFFFSTFLCLTHSKQPRHPHPSVEKGWHSQQQGEWNNYRYCILSAQWQHQEWSVGDASALLDYLQIAKLLWNCTISCLSIVSRSRIAIPPQTQPGQSTAQLISWLMSWPTY